MKGSRFLSRLFLLTLLCTAAALLRPALADANPKFTGSWYAVSFVLDGKELFPDTWKQDLVMVLNADGRFSWSGRFYDDFFGIWSAPSDSEVRLIADEEDGTPGVEEDGMTLNLNQEGCLVYIEENGPVITFADHMPEKPAWPEAIRTQETNDFSGAWVLDRIMVSDSFITPAQFAAFTGTEASSSIVLDELDAYLYFSTNKEVVIDRQIKMKNDNGILVQARDSDGIYLPSISLTDIGMLAVEFCPDGSGENPLMFYYARAE